MGVPPATKGDLAFVEHMLTVMKPDTGRLAVVMPQGVLFRAGAEKGIRQRLMEAGVVEAVIGLPPNLFYNTGLPACILVCRSTPSPNRHGQVVFIDASERFVKQGARNIIAPEDIAAIVAAYRTGEDPDGEGGVAPRLVPIDEIAQNHWDMSISRYVGRAADEMLTVERAFADYVAAREELAAAQVELDGLLESAGHDG